MPEIEYIIHDSPIGRSRLNHIAMVDLGRFGFPGQLEQVWLEPINGLICRVACLPFRVYGLAYQDEVKISGDGSIIEELLNRGGHRIWRVFLDDKLSSDEFTGVRSKLIAGIAASGMKSEWSGDRHVAIDVPPGGNVRMLFPIISPYLPNGLVHWEWADSLAFVELLFLLCCEGECSEA
jgi:hypothetical protein